MAVLITCVVETGGHHGRRRPGWSGRALVSAAKALSGQVDDPLAHLVDDAGCRPRRLPRPIAIRTRQDHPGRHRQLAARAAPARRRPQGLLTPGLCASLLPCENAMKLAEMLQAPEAPVSCRASCAGTAIRPAAWSGTRRRTPRPGSRPGWSRILTSASAVRRLRAPASGLRAGACDAADIKRERGAMKGSRSTQSLNKVSRRSRRPGRRAPSPASGLSGGRPRRGTPSGTTSLQIVDANAVPV